MPKTKQYKCVNCGEESAALFRNYGPSVVKLTKCDNCKGIVDKYIEYDPVIVMIDLVLISKEAQRHIIYNTEFKSYWKLFIILIMLETYGVWRNDSLFNIGINTVCNIQGNNTINSTHLILPLNKSLPAAWRNTCSGWTQHVRDDETDLFIWEKDFYILFVSTVAGIAMFIITIHGLMKLLKTFTTQSEVSITRVLKAFSLANMSILFTLPMLVWGNTEQTSPETRTIHYLLVFCYSFVVFYTMFTVTYESPTAVTILALITSNCVKYLTTFHVAPYVRSRL